VRTVGIIPRIGKDDAVSLCRELVAWLSQRGLEALVEAQPGVLGCPTAVGTEIAARADLLVVLGGDGTLLHAARLCAGREVPILGVNLGTLGFLTEATRDRIRPLLERALAGELQPSHRLMLAARVRSGNRTVLDDAALNDVVVSRAAQSHLARLEVEIDGSSAANYDADGLIIATPTGSTAYSLAAGGPIVYPTLEAMVLTPICPHALTQRPVVLPASAKVRVKIHSGGEMFLTVDGQAGRPLEPGEEVLVQAAPQRTLILRNPDVEPFGIWRDKLRWGAR
jgi:NAD+ kinase